MKTKLPFDPNTFTLWEPFNGWLVLLPSRTDNKRGEILIPESASKKTNQGICIKCSSMDEDYYLGKECFFSTHSEYGVKDTETGYDIIIIEANKILMVRTPSKDVMTFSLRKTEGMSFSTIEHKASSL